MKPFYLSEITTKDGLIHQGIFFAPKKQEKRAILWVHGLTGRFYGDTQMMNEFADACEGNGWGFASYNTRGHDQIAGATIVDKTNPKGYIYGEIGAGYEEFEKCIFDIQAAVDFLVSKGFSEVILVGHSTGATKVCYCEGTQPHANVTGIVFTGPLSDRIAPDANLSIVQQNISRMEKMVADGKGDELVNGLAFFPMTPKRYLSLYKKGSAEDVFDYDDSNNGLRVFSNITKPLCIIVSEKDEYLERPAADLVKIFDAKTKSQKYTSMVFPNATHGFDGKEKEAVDVISKWVQSI